MATQQKLIQARELIKDKKYEEAYEILTLLEHPTAQKWMQKLEEDYGVSQTGIIVFVEPEPPIPIDIDEAEQIEQKLAEARDLIKQEQFQDAYKILSKLDHPTATKWMQKLEQDYGISKPKRGIVPPATSLSSQIDDLDFIRQRLLHARSLIDSEKYQEAYKLLITLDHPKAEVWIDRLKPLIAATTNPGGSQVITNVITNVGGNPGCLVQGIWFLFVGWWLGQVVILLAWSLMFTIIGMPVAIWLINHISGAIALRSSKGSQPNNVITTTTGPGGTTVTDIVNTAPRQHNIFVRILYFLFIGWWASFIWMQIAYFMCIIIIGMPLGFWMLDRTPSVLTLRRAS